MPKGQPMIALDMAPITAEGNSWPCKSDSSNAPFTAVSSLPPEIWLDVYFEIQNTRVNCLGIFLYYCFLLKVPERMKNVSH